MNLGSYWFSDKIVLRMYRAQEVGAEHPLYQMTRAAGASGRAADAEGLHHPGPSPNAFATGRNPGARGRRGDRRHPAGAGEHELEGVIAHELAHVKHRDILISSIAATIAAAIMMLARMAMYAGMFGGGRDDRDGGSNPIALLAMMILAPMAAMLIQMAISRSREFAADAGGAADHRQSVRRWPTRCGRSMRVAKRVPLDANPATAHMFIMKPFSGGGLMSLFSTHPPTEARIAGAAAAVSR